MKVIDVVTARPTLEKIAAMEMNCVAAREFAAFLAVVLDASQKFEVKRAELFRKYGEEVGEGEQKGLRIKSENDTKFKSAMTKAGNKEVDVEPFDLSSTGVNLMPADLLNALPLFK
jgi:hypothetical protein